MTEPNLCPVCSKVLKVQTRATVNLDFNIAILDGISINLTPNQAVILHTMISIMPRMAKTWLLMDRVYGLEADHPSEKVIHVHICRIRKKIKDTNYKINNLWGEGFHIVRISKGDS